MSDGSDNTGKPASGDGADLQMLIEQLDAQVSQAKVLYEQYFLGVQPFAPDKEHNAIRMLIRKLRKSPFKSSAAAFKLRAVEVRYNTLHTYWQRVLREREAGTYAPDVFKANLRDRQALDDARAQTSAGKAEQHMHTLFDSYRGALERQTGKKQTLDFDAFQRSLIQRAKDLQAKHGMKKLAFKVVVKGGKVTVQAIAKDK